MDERDTTPDPVHNPPVLGSLYYIDRKSGVVKQHYPIDAERITFGRDADCDIRLHWEDISRIHAEIQFDLLEGTVTLNVLGSGGLYYITAGRPKQKLASSSRQQLQSGDSFIIRKKLFKFEYSEAPSVSTSVMSPSIMGTPVRPVVAGTPIKATTPLRRRASHRLSLMPADKPFVPLSPMKRRSSNAGQPGHTPKKTHLSTEAVQEDVEEEDGTMEGIVEVQQNEDGDMIVLETREEELEPAQKTATPPKTPRSVPLPPPAQTPYNQGQTPQRVSSQVAMSTPPGPMTLHKALLLRSARKAWVQSRPNDVNDAVDDGNIEVRRKSRSPSKEEEGASGKRKSLTPRKSTSVPADDISDEEEEVAVLPEQEETEEAGVEVEEGDASFVEDRSAEESLEADMSLDIVENDSEDPTAGYEQEGIGQENPSINVEVEENGEEGGDAENAEEDDLFDSQPMNFTPVASRTLDRFYTPQVSRHHGQPRRSLASIGGPAVRGIGVASPNPLGGGAFRPTPSRATPQRPQVAVKDEEGDDVVESKMETPMKKAISDREIAEIKKRRQSLATPRHLPAAPTSFKEPISTFSLVKSPSHPALRQSTEDDQQDEDEVANTPLGDIRSRLNKLKRDSSARELAKPAGARRATVGFVLPETPARPVIQTSASYTAAPAARIMAYNSTAPQTPVVRPEEDDSVVSSLHQTPARNNTASTIGTPFSLMHRTPVRESPEPAAAALETTASSPSHMARSSSPTLAPSSPDVLEIKVDRPQPQAKTPDYKGVKTLLRDQQERQPPKTPYMGDIKTLYPTIPAIIPASPALSGIKKMYPTIPLPPKTPDMRGLKGMFKPAQRSLPGTPDLGGVGEMFASPSPVKVGPGSARSAGGDGEGGEAGTSTEVEEPIEYKSPRRIGRVTGIASSAAVMRKKGTRTDAGKAKAGVMRGKKAVVEAEEQEEVDEHEEQGEPEEDEEEEEVEEQEMIELKPAVPAARQARFAPSAKAAGSRSSRVPTTASTTSRSRKTTAAATAASSASSGAVEAEVEKASVPKKRPAPSASGTKPAETASKSSRRTAATAAPAPALIEIAEAAPVKPTRARAAPAKSTKTGNTASTAPPPSSVPASPEAPVKPSRGRPKKALEENRDQPVVILGEMLEDSPVKTTSVASKPTRGGRTAISTEKNAKAAAASGSTTTSKSARSRAAKVEEAEKENEDVSASTSSKAASAPAPAKSRARAGKKIEVEVAAPATRATRSRK